MALFLPPAQGERVPSKGGVGECSVKSIQSES